MANLLRNGVSWLLGQMQAELSDEAIYSRGDRDIACRATLGRKLLRISDGAGQTRVEVTDADFLIAAADLRLGGLDLEPSRGDRLRVALDVGVYEFEVAPYGDEPPFRWSDPWRTIYRIHCKMIGPAGIT